MLWPADMPDDMLEDAINVSKNALDENDFEANGVEVSFKNFINSKIIPITINRNRKNSNNI